MKLLYASRAANLSEKYGEEYIRHRITSEAGIILNPGTGFPRNKELSFYKPDEPLPELHDKPIITFRDATDKRAMEIAAIAEAKPDMPIIAYWSGGIDSTLILTAIFKNWPKHLIDRLKIKITNASYVENPRFFTDIIKPSGIEYGAFKEYNYSNAFIIHGDPADALWIGGNVLTFNVQYNADYDGKLSTNKDAVLKYFADKTNKEHAEWLFEQLKETANISNYPLDTVSDVFWWLIFNYNYPMMCLKHFAETPVPEYNLYKENFILWFHTIDYQAWSVQAQYHQQDVKFDGSIRSYKMPAKEYIYEFDKNQYYRDFKTKLHSSYLSRWDLSRLLVLYEDHTYILRDDVC